MANIKISALPLFTGNTDGGYLVFNDSGETTTYKMIKDTLFYVNSTTQGYRATGSDTNINLVLSPKGNGFFSLDEPDGTAVGGNTRGPNSVDLQTVRSSASQVASGQESIILAGLYNTSGGYRNVAAGEANNITGIEGMVMGLGNNNSGNFTTALGSFGSISASNGLIAGTFLSLNADNSFVCGEWNIGNSRSSITSGIRALNYIQTSFVRASGYAVSVGDSQDAILGAFSISSVAPSGELQVFVDGSSSTIPLDGNNRLWQINCRYTLVCTTSGGGGSDPAVGDIFAGEDVFTFKKVGGTLSQVGTSSTVHSNSDSSLSTTVFAPSVGGSNTLKLAFTVPNTSNNNTYKAMVTLSITENAW